MFSKPLKYGNIHHNWPEGRFELSLAILRPCETGTRKVDVGRPKLCQAGRPAYTSPRMSRETTAPVLVGGRAVDCYSQGLRQPVLVERDVGDHPFQLAVFFLQVSEPPQFVHTQVRVLLVPGIARGVTHPKLYRIGPQKTHFNTPRRLCYGDFVVPLPPSTTISNLSVLS